MSLERVVSHFKTGDLSGEEILKLIGKPPVLYSDLKHYKSLDALLGKHNYCVILYQTSSRTTGHFVAISRNDETGKVRFADSYGLYPDGELQYTEFDKVLPKYLTRLLEGVDFEYNTIDYQSKRGAIATCGRHSSLFCLFRNLSLQAIQEMYRTNKSTFLQDTDNVVVLLTLVGLKDIPQYLEKIPRGM
jgi:hypothetical protein